MNIKDCQIVLASGSPRRRELLARESLTFQVIPAIGEEVYTETLPEKIVAELAKGKATEVYERLMKAPGFFASDARPLLVIAADTVVSIDDCILGKPKDESDAARMLRALSGRTHKVSTGFALILKVPGHVRRTRYASETTLVTFKEMTDTDISEYIGTGEPMDKAGSYGIQGIGGKFVSGIQGDYDNVVGLPVKRVISEIEKMLQTLVVS